MSTARPISHAVMRPASFLERLGRKGLEQRLSGLVHGSVALADARGERRFGNGEPQVTLRVNDPAFHASVALRGSVGAGESYVRGEWSCDDLPLLLGLILRNRDVFSSVDSGLARLAAPLLRLAHALRSNTRAGSRRNIAAHYDTGNEFFALVLDETMTYSCGIFESDAATLKEASIAKLDRACRKLRLRPADRLLEIGTGWGSLALHAAEHYGCHVTTTTISQEQHELARERIERAGLQDRITLLLEDYRDLKGEHDKLISIEMIEAVGEAHLGEYFAACERLLAPQGQMLLQAITIADQHHGGQSRAPDFIKRHVFPGSHIPSLTRLATAATQSSDLRITHVEDLTPHYARTLAAWRRRLHANRAEIQALGFDDQQVRAWDFYFAYCEAGFAERYLGDLQLLLSRPGYRGEVLLPPVATP